MNGEKSFLRSPAASGKSGFQFVFSIPPSQSLSFPLLTPLARANPHLPARVGYFLTLQQTLRTVPGLLGQSEGRI